MEDVEIVRGKIFYTTIVEPKGSANVWD